MQVRGVAGYDEDMVFLVVPDEFNFGRRVPLVVGTCTISRLINVIHESEIDSLAMPWSTTRVVRLLSCQLGTAIPASEGAETPEEGASGRSPEGSIDELVTVWESVHLGLFQTEIIEGRVKPLLGSTSYVMITLLKVEGRPRETKLLPLGLHAFHAYTRLKNDSGRVSLVVRNVLDSQIFLKKGVPVVRVVSASLVLPMELSPELEATLGEEPRPEPLSVAARQEKLLEKLNLDGLTHWSPENVVAARELVLAYHDVFVLESNELGCTSAIEHVIRIENDEPFKERFQHIPPPLLEEVRASLRDMLEAGAIRSSQSPWFGLAFLRELQMPQCVYEEGLVPPAMDSGGPLKHGGVSAFFVDGFQVGLLVDKDGPRITTVHSLYGGEPRVQQVYLPFGLCNAPATFQHLMQNTLGELNLTYCVIYLDDVIVFGRMEEEHLEHLRMVFERFCKFNLKLKPL